MVFYRKYRPQKISELDNELVRESLNSIFSKENSVHAFLFTGPKGLGKTSTARIVAKVINCVGRKNKKDIEPCNECEQCISITNGNNLDIIEIDGASNRGIDEIRDLREKIKLSPFKANKKIYIIDEVHMLTTEAFNALLKTLEEPPLHAVFILCTTELHKVPATIISRCFRLNFTKATPEELTRSISRIVEAEKLNIENQAILEIANLSDGSFRDGAKILEEVVGFSNGKKITKDLVNEKFNILGISDYVNEIFSVFKNKDISGGINLCKKLETQGMDFKFFSEKLIEKLHEMLLMEANISEGKSLFTIDELKILFKLLSAVNAETKYAVLPQLPLEVAIIEYCRNDSDTLNDFKNQVKKIDIQKEPALKNEIPLTGLSTFTEIINEVKNHNNLFAGVLRGCKADEISNGKLVITASSKFHKEKIEEAKNLLILKDSVRKITGKDVKIDVIMRGGE